MAIQVDYFATDENGTEHNLLSVQSQYIPVEGSTVVLKKFMVGDDGKKDWVKVGTYRVLKIYHIILFDETNGHTIERVEIIVEPVE